jgi:hypothetical protein
MVQRFHSVYLPQMRGAVVHSVMATLTLRTPKATAFRHQHISLSAHLAGTFRPRRQHFPLQAHFFFTVDF